MRGAAKYADGQTITREETEGGRERERERERGMRCTDRMRVRGYR